MGKKTFRSFKIFSPSSGVSPLASFVLLPLPNIDGLPSSALRKLEASDATLSTLATDHPDIEKHIRSEIEAREETAQLKSRLESYERIFGSDAQLSAESKDLVERLRQKEKIIEELRLVQQQESAVRIIRIRTFVTLEQSTDQFWFSIVHKRSVRGTSANVVCLGDP